MIDFYIQWPWKINRHHKNETENHKSSTALKTVKSQDYVGTKKFQCYRNQFSIGVSVETRPMSGGEVARCGKTRIAFHLRLIMIWYGTEYHQYATTCRTAGHCVCFGGAFITFGEAETVMQARVVCLCGYVTRPVRWNGYWLEAALARAKLQTRACGPNARDRVAVSAGAGDRLTTGLSPRPPLPFQRAPTAIFHSFLSVAS